MKKVVVIGGGLAGLSAAAFLSNSGKAEVEVLEASPKPGGRAYSFCDSSTGDIIDNGQHIMMGCYNDTLEFLGLIGSLDKVFIQPALSVNFVHKEKGITALNVSSKLYPVNLLSGMLQYKALPVKDRLKIIKLLSKLLFIHEESLSGLPVLKWLEQENQSQKSIKAFWEILAIGALNSDINQADSAIFVHILKRMFLNGNKAASIILPRTGLSEMYCPNAVEFISAHKGCISLSEPVRSLEVSNGKVRKIITQSRDLTRFDYVLSAVPLYSLERILPGGTPLRLPVNEIRYSSILSAHIWLKENHFTEKFYGLIDSPVHWVFNHNRHITIVISNADQIIEKDKEDIYRIVLSELKSYFRDFDEKDVTSYRIIKEKRATFIPDEGFLKRRPEAVTPISNLFLAGDWTNTGLPATIEGAVQSGKTAADQILRA